MRASKPSGLGLGETSNELLGTGRLQAQIHAARSGPAEGDFSSGFLPLKRRSGLRMFESLGLRDVLPRQVCSCDREGGGMSVTCAGCETDMQRWGESRGEVRIPRRCLCTYDLHRARLVRHAGRSHLREPAPFHMLAVSSYRSGVQVCVIVCVLVIVVPVSVLYLNHHVGISHMPSCRELIGRSLFAVPETLQSKSKQSFVIEVQLASRSEGTTSRCCVGCVFKQGFSTPH
ncbi:hypothetical protein CGRA01v4_11479 [Colletotrichum graminicola]|nr:hypothetical protein CGRA01v4_11479 [Colletotrichum graminicola]